MELLTEGRRCCLCGFESRNWRLFMRHYLEEWMCQSTRKCTARIEARHSQ